jgi:hypothetical protein
MPVPLSARPIWFQPDAPPAPGWNLRLGEIRQFLGNQEKDNWCWAAVTALASKMLGLNGGQGFSQVEVVRRVDSTEADEPNSVLSSWNAVGIVNAIEIQAASLAGDRAEVLNRVARGQPVGIHIDWSTIPPVTGHELCAIAVGKIGGEPALAVYDPAKGGDTDNIVQLPLSGLRNYYSGDETGRRGIWSATVRLA